MIKYSTKTVHKTNDIIPIFLIAANDIVAQMSVTMASVLANTKSFIQFYVLEKSTLLISENNRSRILKLKNDFPNFLIEFLPIDPEDYADLTPTTAGYIPNDTYFRYVIPEIKKDIKKSIYLDVDVIVKKDIKELFNENLHGKLIGVVNHPKICWNYSYNRKVMDNLKLKNYDVYINAGVIVFDCEKCRKAKITKKLFVETRKLKDRIFWADQDIFNLVFQSNLQLLPERYNALRTVYESEKIKDQSIIDDLCIIHFNGVEKPWCDTPFLNEYFWEYAKLTDFQSDLLEQLNNAFRNRIAKLGKDISFLLGKVSEFSTQDKHISFILGRIKEYDSKQKQGLFLNKLGKYSINLFGYVPMWTVELKTNKIKYKLFSIIPIIKIITKNNEKKYFIFSFIPFWKIKYCSSKNKYFIFNRIPLLSFAKKKEDVELNANKLFLKNKLSYNPKQKIKIYFLFHSKAFWPSWQSFWLACNKDIHIETKMIFCPIKKQSPEYEGQFVGAEQFLIDQKINYVNIKDIDLSIDKPHVLIIQTPYDEYHRDPQHGSSYFKCKGLRVVYLSYGLEFTETDLSITNHFQLPIYKNAWRLYPFANFLIEDYRKYGKIYPEKIKCLGHPKFDEIFLKKNSYLIKRIKKKVGDKKIIVWHPHFPCNYSKINNQSVCSTFSWQDNLKILDFIEKQKNLFFIFMPHHLFFSVFERQFSVSHQEIERFRSKLEQSSNVIWWKDDYPEILNVADAFMGERSAVTMEMIATQKPVLYLEQHAEIYNTFGKEATNAFYKANTFADVVTFIKMFKKNKDPKQELRNKVFNKFISPFFDGKCGERIKNDIIKSLKEEK